MGFVSAELSICGSTGGTDEAIRWEVLVCSSRRRVAPLSFKIKFLTRGSMNSRVVEICTFKVEEMSLKRETWTSKSSIKVVDLVAPRSYNPC